MPKFKQGETSISVIEKKVSITESMIKKSEILDTINSFQDIPESLNYKKNSISQSSVHEWSDSNLGVIGYSRNSAHKKHNTKALKQLIQSIQNINERISKSNQKRYVKNRKLTTNLSTDDINKLKLENNELRIALAEVYRAYMQLLSNASEDEHFNESYRNIILSQARVLGKKRLWSAK